MTYATVMTRSSSTQDKLTAKLVFRDRVFDTMMLDANLNERDRFNLRDSYLALCKECAQMERDICAEKEAAWLAS